MTRRYGRNAPYSPEERPRLMLGPALRLDQITVPTMVDYVTQVDQWPMYLNDQIGDCTIAAAGHMVEAWTQYALRGAVRVTDQDVLTAYEAVSGYNPKTGANDNGAVMQDVLDYWRKTGVGGHKILAFAELNLTNADEMKAALYLFGHVYFGLAVPYSAETQFDNGQPWDVVKNDGGIAGGHAVDIGYRDASMWQLVTWGAAQQMTAEFLGKYGEEAWVVVSQEWINVTGGSPPGLDTAQLNAQFTALTGKPGPFPTTPPAPTPTPVPPAPGDPDAALAAVAHRWVGYHHTSIAENKHMQLALKTWLQAKNL